LGEAGPLAQPPESVSEPVRPVPRSIDHHNTPVSVDAA
jgi:hypothetical protein